jgi:hypothetical protein
MADVNVEMLKESLYKVSKALFCIGEVCVDVSKQHISEEKALNKIRGYLNDAQMWSRFQVDKLIEDCMKPVVYNTFDEYNHDWLKQYLREQPLQTFEVSYPSCCDGCSNNPKNGGSGICNCTLPYMQNPTNYTVPSGDTCMANNTNGHVYFVNNVDDLKEHKANADRIAEAIERTQKYIKRD